MYPRPVQSPRWLFIILSLSCQRRRYSSNVPSAPPDMSSTLCAPQRMQGTSSCSVYEAVLRTIDLYDLHDLGSSSESSTAGSYPFCVTEERCTDIEKVFSSSADAGLTDVPGPTVAFKVRLQLLKLTWSAARRFCFSYTSALQLPGRTATDPLTYAIFSCS